MMRNLEFYQGKGKVFATKAILKELSDAVVVLKERMGRVDP